jgi:D-tyrosyl-tRNA(Tyr) deacylase
VTVEGEPVGSIGPGLVALVGVTHTDSRADAETVAAKLVGLRIFPDEHHAQNRSVSEVGGSILVVSQFTLYGDVRRGRRPSFTEAASPDVAEPLLAHLVDLIRQAGVPVETGRFRAAMQVELVNDGPVTVVIETRDGRLV